MQESHLLSITLADSTAGMEFHQSPKIFESLYQYADMNIKYKTPYTSNESKIYSIVCEAVFGFPKTASIYSIKN